MCLRLIFNHLTISVIKKLKIILHASIFSLSLHHLTTNCRASAHIKIHRGVEQLAARRAHNPEVAGSSPAPATQKGETKMFLLFFVSGSPRLYLHSLPSVPSLWERERLSNHSTKRMTTSRSFRNGLEISMQCPTKEDKSSDLPSFFCVIIFVSI